MFDYLLFDEEATLIRYRIFPAKTPSASDRDLAQVEKKFFDSLRPGDRRRFRQYCNPSPKSFSDRQDLTFELFSLFSFQPYHYAFCEHSWRNHILYTVVFLAKEASEFHMLISPASLTYAPTNERILRELFLLAGTAEKDTVNLPPEVLPLLDLLPNVTCTLRAHDHGRGYCDIRKLTEKILENLRKNPMFMHTELLLAPSVGDSSLWKLEFSSDLYTHILTSLLTALLTVSQNHRIELELTPCRSWVNPALPGANLRISTTLPENPPALQRINDSGTLRVIATPGTVTELHLGVASVLASIAGIETSVMTVLSTGRLEVCLSVFSLTEQPVPEFHFRDPYAAVDALVEEFMDYLSALSSLSDD